MVNVYNFSFEEFENYIDALTQTTRCNNGKIAEDSDKKHFASIEEVDEFYDSTDAIEFFKHEMLNGKK